jgi:uncharacterized protein YjbI with pentapeptide repeats
MIVEGVAVNMDIKNTQGEVILTIEDVETLEGHDFYRQELPGADFRDQNLAGVRFYGCNLEGADFRGAILKRASLQVANLKGADLRTADLNLANLLGANLAGADLSEANLKWAHLKGAKYDRTTRLPKDIDPEKSAMVSLEQTASAAG